MANERPAQQSDIKLLISKGLEQGYLTYAEVNDHLPDDLVDPEQIEDIIGMINGMGIDVHEVAPDAETLLLADGNTGRVVPAVLKASQTVEQRRGHFMGRDRAYDSAHASTFGLQDAPL